MIRKRVIVADGSCLVRPNGTLVRVTEVPDSVTVIDRHGLPSEVRVDYEEVSSSPCIEVITETGYGVVGRNCRVAGARGDVALADLSSRFRQGENVQCEQFAWGASGGRNDRYENGKPQHLLHYPEAITERLCKDVRQRVFEEPPSELTLPRGCFDMIPWVLRSAGRNDDQQVGILEVDNRLYPCRVEVRISEGRRPALAHVLGVTERRRNGLRVRWEGQETRLVVGGLLVS